MTEKRAMMLIALMMIVTLVLAALPAFAQGDIRPPAQRPPIRIDPRVIQRPQLQLRGPEIQFQARFDDRMLERGRSLSLYRLQAPRINQQTLNLLGERLGIRGDTVQSDSMLSMTSGNGGFIMVDQKFGRLVFNVNLAELIDDTPGQLPSDREAGEIALEFLRGNELLPNAEQAAVVHVGGISSASFDPGSGRQGQTMAQALVVHLARNVDGVRVVGPGSKAVVQIGDGGKVAGGGVDWRALGDAQKLDARQVLSTEAVQRSIQDRLRREFSMARNIVVDRVGVFYYDAGDFLQPCVGFQAVVTSGEFKYPYFGQVALMQQPPVLVGPEAIPPEAREMLRMGAQDLKPDETQGD